MDASTIRALVLANPRTPDGYPAHVRDRVGRYAIARRQQGCTWTQLQAEVGICDTSMRNWMRAVEVGGFDQILVIDREPEPVRSLVVTSPSGFTLTGCTLDQAVRVLRALA
jgi:hypothetical protein